MCGIAGIIGNLKKEVGRDLLEKMLKTIQHRGPDSKGLWSKDSLAFGMRRLSIIDLADGDQPIWSDQGVGIVFNGEIYNFKKLRENLEKKGSVFHTSSDTEVILQLYITKGIQAIQELEGMFAICLYDPRMQKVFLIRDRLGVKPLYYYKDKNRFVFSSEIKAILEAIPHKIINNQAIWDYLTLRYVPSPETVWENINKLEAGHFLEYDLNKNDFQIEKYWSLNFCSEKVNKNRNYEKEFETLFLEAVEKRLLASDVPVGILLSGGLDSSSVAAAALELGHKNFHTFSIGFEDGGDFSELDYARKVSSQIGSNHHEIIISQKQFIDFLDEFVWYTDEPIADLASIPLYYVSKLASQYVKVALSGEGADEVLAGYNLNETAQRLFYLKLASYFPKTFLDLLPHDSFKTIGNFGYSNLFRERLPHITDGFSEEEKLQICNFRAQGSTKDYIRALYRRAISSEPLDQLQTVYSHSWLVEDLLMKADKMSMAVSLEIRVPFLDHKLVEWAETLPLEWKIGSWSGGFTTKHILRNFAKKRLSSEITNRPKQGFPVPAYKWLEKNPQLFIKKYLEDPTLNKWIHTKKISHLFVELEQGSIESAHKIWNLIILSCWLRKWTN